MAENEENKDHLDEPVSSYGTKMGITIFSSFAEMNDAAHEEMAATPAAERIRNTVELILRSYGLTREELTRRPDRYIVTIIQGE